MATKKWFGLAAVLAAAGSAVGYALTKSNRSSDVAADRQQPANSIDENEETDEVEAAAS